MNWFKANPFFAGLLAVTAVLLLAGGYLLNDAMTRFAEQTAQFEGHKSTLERLQHDKPFPNEANVQAMQKEHDEALEILKKIGETVRVDMPAMTPQGFQDTLRTKVSDIVSRAKEQEVDLGPQFYLGFEEYENKLPSAEAAPQLALPLASIHNVASILVDSKVREITSIHRIPLPVEGGQAPPSNENRDSAQASDSTLPDLRLAPFEVNFHADQSAFHSSFNRILDAKPSIFIRLVGITNSSRNHRQGRRGQSARHRRPPGRKRHQTRGRTGTPDHQPPTGLDLRRRAASQITTEAMDQIKAHYDRFLLIAAGLLLAGVAVFMAMQSASLSEEFVAPPVMTDGAGFTPDAAVEQLRSESAKASQGQNWQDNKNPLFVSRIYLLGEDGKLVDILEGDTELFAGIPNKWILDHSLDYTARDLPEQDADGDGFTNLEEFRAGTNPKDPKSTPPMWTKLRLVASKIDKLRTKFTDLPDGNLGRVSINTISSDNPNDLSDPRSSTAPAI